MICDKEQGESPERSKELFATKIGKEQGASPESSNELFATKTGKEKNQMVKDLN